MGIFILFVFFLGGGAQAYRHARLDCDAPQLMRHCTVLPPTNRCYWSIRAHQRPRYTYTQPQDNILQSYLCSALVVSLQPGLLWPCTASRLPNKGGPDRCPALPTVTLALLKRHKIKFKKLRLLYTVCFWFHGTLTALTVCPIVLTINIQHSAVTSQLETI